MYVVENISCGQMWSLLALNIDFSCHAY